MCVYIYIHTHFLPKILANLSSRECISLLRYFRKGSNFLSRFAGVHLFWVVSGKNGVNFRFLESVSTGVWCVPGFGTGFHIALEPSKTAEKRQKPGTFIFVPGSGMHQTLVQKKSDSCLVRTKMPHAEPWIFTICPCQARQWRLQTPKTRMKWRMARFEPKTFYKFCGQKKTPIFMHVHPSTHPRSTAASSTPPTPGLNETYHPHRSYYEFYSRPNLPFVPKLLRNSFVFNFCNAITMSRRQRHKSPEITVSKSSKTPVRNTAPIKNSKIISVM